MRLKIIPGGEILITGYYPDWTVFRLIDLNSFPYIDCTIKL